MWKTRVTLVVGTSFLLSGCPATMNAYLKNETNETVRYIYPTGYIDEIKSGETGKVVWGQECLTIDIEGIIYRYQHAYPEDKYIDIGMFSTSFKGRITRERTIVLPGTNDKQLQACE